jgi:hypothetical protein
MPEHEQDRYGNVQAPEPIRIETHGPFVSATPFPNAAPEPAKRAYAAMVRKDLDAQRKQQDQG